MRIVILLGLILGTIFLVGISSAQFTINQKDTFDGLKHFIIHFQEFFEDYTKTHNITTTHYYNGNLLCDNIVGGTDGDFCSDASGSGGNSKVGGSPFLYNDSTTIYFNSTYGNLTYVQWEYLNMTNTSYLTAVPDNYMTFADWNSTNTTYENHFQRGEYSNTSSEISDTINQSSINLTDLQVFGDINLTGNISIEQTNTYIVISDNASRFIVHNGSGWVIKG